LPPISLLAPPNPFLIHRTEYGRMWPDQGTRIVHDSVSLHTLLESGNTQSDTLVLLAHQSYNIMSWAEWAAQMSKMSPNSSFGIAFVYVLYCFSNSPSSLFLQCRSRCCFRA
jgi:hypothetical protein